LIVSFEQEINVKIIKNKKTKLLNFILFNSFLKDY